MVWVRLGSVEGGRRIPPCSQHRGVCVGWVGMQSGGGRLAAKEYLTSAHHRGGQDRPGGGQVKPWGGQARGKQKATRVVR